MLNSVSFQFFPPSWECYCVNQGSQRVLSPCSSKSPLSLFSNWEQFSLQLFLIFSRNVFALPGNKYLGLVFIVYVWSSQWLDLATGLHGCHFKHRWTKGWEICGNRTKMWFTETITRQTGGLQYRNCQNTHICKIHLKNLDLSLCFFPIRLQSTPPLESVPVRMFLSADFKKNNNLYIKKYSFINLFHSLD